jgi:hypothetical protein
MLAASRGSRAYGTESYVHGGLEVLNEYADLGIPFASPAGSSAISSI